MLFGRRTGFGCGAALVLVLAALLAACLLPVAPPAHNGDSESMDDSTSLLQTFQVIDARKPAEDVKARLEATSVDIEEDGAQREVTEDSYCVPGIFSPDYMISLDSLRLLNYLPQRPACSVPEAAKGQATLAMISEKVSARLSLSPEWQHWLPALIPFIFLLLFFVVVMRMLAYILWIDPVRVQAVNKKFQESRPELDSWNRGIMNWLYVDHVTDWIARWGNSEENDSTRIKAEDLGRLGHPADECQVCYAKLETKWNEEVENVGLQNASVFMVLLRYHGWRRIITLGLWTTSYEMFMYLGPPLAMVAMVSHLDWIFLQRLSGTEVSPQELLYPTALAILMFSGLPIGMGISNTFSTMLSMRLGVRTTGALSALCFKKAQRLPMATDHVEDKEVQWKTAEDSAKASRHRADLAGENVEDSTSDEEAKVDGKASDEHAALLDGETNAEGAYLEDGSWRVPERFNLVQVIANDVSTNIVMIPLMFMKALMIVPITAVLFFMLFRKIHSAVFLCLGLGVFFFCCVVVNGISQAGFIQGFFYWSGKRLQFLEDMLFNIRTVKACGWEEVCNDRIDELRHLEVDTLRSFYWRLGVMFCLFQQAPALFIILAVWGSMWLSGDMTPVNIWETLPILFTFQGALTNMLSILPQVIQALPSLTRVNGFLKQAEAPNGAPRTEFVPKYMDIWPQARLSDYSCHTPQLRVQGSFSWLNNHKPQLKDVDFSVPIGSSVAVIGMVGSGKSTFLHAILGELYPVGDARISVPMTMAYSAQCPYIIEGTLKDNILFGEPFDQDRFHNCVYSTSLLPDIEILPGGDEVPIGSRGISLSGGQKARVSMARVGYTNSPVVLLDDPFGAVDSRTARHILEHYVHGTCLQGRTRIVVTQPDPERIKDFDTVVIIHKGRIVVQGTPEQVKATEEYNRMLNAHQKADLLLSPRSAAPTPATQTVRADTGIVTSGGGDAQQLREDEGEGRAGWSTLSFFLGLGGYFNITICIGFFLLKCICELLEVVQLQVWSTQILQKKAHPNMVLPDPNSVLFAFIAWWGAAIACWWICWCGGLSFTIRLSLSANMQTMNRVIHAPVDFFFDKTPVGRIMNRLSTDLQNVDIQCYNQITQAIACFFQFIVPIVYVHVLMPLYFTLITLPVYVMMTLVVRRYWNTFVPLRYLTHVSKSETDSCLTDVEHSNSFVRALQKGTFRFDEFQVKIANQIKADVCTTTFCKRWVIMRVYLLLAFYVTTMVCMMMWIPNIVTFGAVGLCLSNLLKIACGIESDVEVATSSQFQFISMNRIFEYTKLPQERDYELPGDKDCKSVFFTVWRGKLGKLSIMKDVDGNTARPVKIVRKTLSSKAGGDSAVVVLEEYTGGDQRPGAAAFVPASGMTYSSLDPKDAQLLKVTNWHRLEKVNGSEGTIDSIADELCNGHSAQLKLHIQSGWLADGAQIVIEDLTVRYGDIPRDIIKNFSLEIVPRSKVAVVGTTGCGKSTLLLALLRILEPREGRILINGIDTQKIGLGCLRQAIGLVPQDPVLFQCSVRDNIDSYRQYDDATIWEGLRMVQLEQEVKDLEGGLEHNLTAGFSNLSFGQRQLLCLSRVVIRQSRLILLDEATSALDPHTQELVQNTIETRFPSSTIVVIAHRLETILDFDMVVVLEQGRIAEKGSVADLRKTKDSIFSKMLSAKETW